MLELDGSDPTYSISSITLLSALVPLLGFINANLPILPPVLKRVFKSFSGWTSAAPSSGSGGYGKRSAGTNTIGSARSHQFERLGGEEHAPEMPLVSLNRQGRASFRGDGGDIEGLGGAKGDLS